jgi:glycosyltransferase involved in cell wall biosynthesis
MRIAIFSPGGVGAGVFSQGLPAIATIVGRLSRIFDVSFYSLHSIDPGFTPSGYRVYSPPDSSRAGFRKWRWIALAGRFLADHAARPYDLAMSFWGYPMGTVVVCLARLVRIPSMVILLGAETANLPRLDYGHLRGGPAKRMLLWTCARASRLIAVSQSQLEALRSNGVDRDDAEVIPFGAEAELFVFEQKARGPVLKVLHVANLTEVKDQETLLRAFALLCEDTAAVLRIVGEDAMGGALQRLAVELAIADRVDFRGPVPFAEMPEHYRWADIFVLTSLSEGQNRSLTEAAMSGVLQVSTPVGHIRDLGDDVAVVVKVGDPADIAEKVRAILLDPSKWEQKVANARAWAAAHSMQWTVSNLSRAIQNLIETSRCSTAGALGRS